MIPDLAQRTITRTGMLLIAAATFLAWAGPAEAAAPSKLLDDLMAAYNGESNAQATYVAYAKKADQDGYAGVASLFRAAARGEESHARTHAEVIKKLGGTPSASVQPAPVKTTVENLKAAIEAESFERDKMYPRYVADALAAANKDAIKDFKAVVAVEAEHAKLLAQAAANLASWKSARKFFVCQTCGLPVLIIDFNKCPICFSETSDFIEVS
jgi:rubrerythrin